MRFEGIVNPHATQRACGSPAPQCARREELILQYVGHRVSADTQQHHREHIHTFRHI